MPRLPVVSSDADVWGNVLNSYLGVALNADGTLKPGAAVKLKAGAITDADFSATPPDGSLGVNTNAGALAFRNLGAWLQLLPSRAKAGPLLDADFGSGPVPAGALGVNTLLPALNFRAASSWFQILPPKAKAGALTDADFGAAPPDGTVAVNTATNALAFRSSGSWFQLTTVAPAAPGLELDYKQLITPTPVTGTTEGTATVLATGASVTYDGSRVKLEAWAPSFQAVAGSGGLISFGIWRDATLVCAATGLAWAGAGGTPPASVKIEGYESPSAGAHTYAFKAWLPGASGSPSVTVQAGAGGTGSSAPAFLRVTKA